MITIYTSEEIEKIAAAGKLTADTLSMLEKAVRPGISTLELDEMAEKWHAKNDKPKSVRKAMKYIKQQKERRGI